MYRQYFNQYSLLVTNIFRDVAGIGLNREVPFRQFYFSVSQLFYTFSEHHAFERRSLAGIVGSKSAGSSICLSLVSVVCRGLCVGLIARPEESYRVWFVWV